MTRALHAIGFLMCSAMAAFAQDAPGIKAFSKYDFVPGTQIILFEDFLDDAIGDLPGGWDTNASGEVVTIEGRTGRWLMFTKGGVFLPVLSAALPDTFTLEFDLLPGTPFTAGTQFVTRFVELENVNQPAAWHGANNRYTFGVHPGVRPSPSADRRARARRRFKSRHSRSPGRTAA